MIFFLIGSKRPLSTEWKSHISALARISHRRLRDPGFLRPRGFRNAELRQHLAALSGREAKQIAQGAMSCQLRRLRLHGMIERIPKTHRRCVTAMGLRAALLFRRSYARVLRAGLAFALPGHRAVDTPLKRNFDNLEKEIQAWTNRGKLAA